VTDVDLEVHEGEIVALVGANGAGKTTLLSTLAGLVPVQSGEVELLGSAETVPFRRRARTGLSYIGEDRSVIRTLRTADYLRLAGADRTRCLELFPELEPLLGRTVNLLSGGEQQMLSLGRALATGPRVLLADELSLGLAPLVVRRLHEELRRAAAAGTGILVVEQQVRAAVALADHVYVLRRGQVVLSGRGSDLQSSLSRIEDEYLGRRSA
jgi:branched-chain amino acid transport system ATP-binding protein